MLKLIVFALVAICVFHKSSDAQPPAPPAPPAAPATDDPTAIYRFDPFLNELVPMAQADVKPGFIYSRHSPALNRRVWSVARAGGGFDYAMAPGSVQPARALDLRATPEELRQELMARAPELARVMDIRGGVAHMRLTADESWVLVGQPTISNVFDLETGRRWEWHGPRRVAVVHTGGGVWMNVQGRPEAPMPSALMTWAPCY